jgi:RNA polymerase subunit RPABC4/transcription elongation factor Spt4
MMNWCHKCGKFRDVERPICMCSECMEEWRAAYVARNIRHHDLAD